MKKIFYSLFSLVALLLFVFTFTSCSSDDNSEQDVQIEYVLELSRTESYQFSSGDYSDWYNICACYRTELSKLSGFKDVSQEQLGAANYTATGKQSDLNAMAKSACETAEKNVTSFSCKHVTGTLVLRFYNYSTNKEGVLYSHAITKASN